jgi:hypothetical protein
MARGPRKIPFAKRQRVRLNDLGIAAGPIGRRRAARAGTVLRYTRSGHVAVLWDGSHYTENWAEEYLRPALNRPPRTLASDLATQGQEK